MTFFKPPTTLNRQSSFDFHDSSSLLIRETNTLLWHNFGSNPGPFSHPRHDPAGGGANPAAGRANPAGGAGDFPPRIGLPVHRQHQCHRTSQL